MSFFRYSALDSAGKGVEGTVEAASIHEAARSLEARGFRLRQIVPASAAPASTQLVAPVGHEAIRTRRARDKDRFLLFSQVASLLRGGNNPHQSFEMMASRTRHAGLQRACRDVAQATRDGLPMSAVLARYPHLFPPHVAGMVRAGEEGGFLPEACERVAEQAESAHSFGRMLWMASAVAFHGLLILPAAWLLSRSVLLAWEKVDAAGGAGGASGGIQLMAEAIVERLKWPVGPWTLAAYALAWIGWLVWLSMPMRRLRHRMGLRWVAFGPRARHESLAIFSWALSRVSNAGLAPHAAWALALDCVPNLAMRERLAEAGSKLRESTPMSQAFFDSRLFPDEYAPMMATAEQTGDVPGTLSRLADLGKSEFETASGKAKWRTGCWSYLGCFVCSAAVAGMFIWMWLYELPKKILEGF